MKIGNVEIKNRVIVAPMAGVTDQAFRYLLKKYEPGLIYTEMISDKGLLHNNTRTKNMIDIDDSIRPISLQLFGSDKDSLRDACAFVLKNSNPDIIDINMGCPVHKVINAGAGSALLQDPDKIYEIIKELKKVSTVPITIKIRSGWDHKSINAVEVAKKAEEAGVDAICVHPRTKSDLYRGTSDWEIIKQVKEAVKIPVIGNGDIKTPEDAKRMLDETGCDFVMIGRGLLGNPWLVKQTIDYLEKGTYEKQISIDEKFKILFEHMDLLIDDKGEKVGILEMRGHAAWYIKGLTQATQIKKEISSVSTKQELVDLISNYKKSLESHN